ncbi:MAG: Gfo/Idh/MocA family oxidoreductase [Candidatus Omnitrophica bacterium]|nr:Gfo/Idh/MocA family oxidoreductase [Candidatus Omnitrophota bacterium]
MANEIRFGIVGLGMGRGRANLIPETSGAKLVAVCDIWEERGKLAEKELGCEWIKDYDQLLKRDDIDVVGIFTPSGTHGQFLIKALQAGKHAFTTKPMDIRVKVCDEAIELAEKKGLVLAVDFGLRYEPDNHRIKAALQQGAIGKLIAAEMSMKWFRAQSYYDGGKPAGWRSRLETEGGSLANQAVHFLDLLLFWLGPVKTIYGKKGTFAHRIETEDTSAGVVEFQSGTLGTIFSTTCSFPGQGTSITLTGSTGSLVWHDGKVSLFERMKQPAAAEGEKPGYVLPENAPAPEPEQLNLVEFPSPKDLPKNIIEDMVAAITSGQPVQCDGKTGRESVALFCGLYLSSDTSQPVTLP